MPLWPVYRSRHDSSKPSSGAPALLWHWLAGKTFWIPDGEQFGHVPNGHLIVKMLDSGWMMMPYRPHVLSRLKVLALRLGACTAMEKRQRLM